MRRHDAQRSAAKLQILGAITPRPDAVGLYVRVMAPEGPSGARKGAVGAVTLFSSVGGSSLWGPLRGPTGAERPSRPGTRRAGRSRRPDTAPGIRRGPAPGA